MPLSNEEFAKQKRAEMLERAERTGECQYFAKCTNPHSTTVPNPVLGDVPCCQKCHDFFHKLEQPQAHVKAPTL